MGGYAHRYPFRRCLGAAFALAAASAGVAASGAAGAPFDTHLLSRGDGVAGAPGNAASGAAEAVTGAEAVSDDGCRVAFSSGATDFGVGPPNIASGGVSHEHAYVRDRCTGETIFVSGPTGASARHPGESTRVQSISGDGNRVAFLTKARLNPTADKNASFDVYVRDIAAATTTLVSAGRQGYAVGALAESPSLSQGGRYVTFSTATRADKVVAGATEAGFGDPDLFVRDTATGSSELASGTDLDPLVTGNGASGDGSISDDGSRVALTTAASDLFPGDSNDSDDVVVRDLVSGATSLASRRTGADGEQSEGKASSPTISGDGGTVAFACGACGLADGEASSNAYVRDLDAGTTELVSRRSGSASEAVENAARELSISDDGRFVAFGSEDPTTAEGGPAAPLAYVRDRVALQTSLASRATGPLGAAASLIDFKRMQPGLSGDGSFVSFPTPDSGLDPSVTDANGLSDVYGREVPTLPPPVEGQTANAFPIAGTVTVDGELLERPEQVAIGSRIDTSAGRVEIVSDYNGTVQSAEFYRGSWKIQQRQGAKPVLFMKLTGKRNCRPAASAAGERRKRRGRRGWGRGSGRVGSRGNRGSGSVRGTTWFTFDRCDGATVFKVTEGGPLFVDDFGKRGKVNVRLREGQRYVARAKAPRRR